MKKIIKGNIGPTCSKYGIHYQVIDNCKIEITVPKNIVVHRVSGTDHRVIEIDGVASMIDSERNIRAVLDNVLAIIGVNGNISEELTCIRWRRVCEHDYTAYNRATMIEERLFKFTIDICCKCGDYKVRKTND